MDHDATALAAAVDTACTPVMETATMRDYTPAVGVPLPFPTLSPFPFHVPTPRLTPAELVPSSLVDLTLDTAPCRPVYCFPETAAPEAERAAAAVAAAPCHVLSTVAECPPVAAPVARALAINALVDSSVSLRPCSYAALSRAVITRFVLCKARSSNLRVPSPLLLLWLLLLKGRLLLLLLLLKRRLLSLLLRHRSSSFHFRFPRCSSSLNYFLLSSCTPRPTLLLPRPPLLIPPLEMHMTPPPAPSPCGDVIISPLIIFSPLTPGGNSSLTSSSCPPAAPPIP